MFYNVIFWLDDIRDPALYRKINDAPWRDHSHDKVIWCHSVNEAIDAWLDLDGDDECIIQEINLDHDAGDFAFDGGDYIKFLDWLEEHKVDFTRFHWKIHSMNPVGIQNMLVILRRNGVNC